MLVRREEYQRSPQGVPFRFYTALERTREIRSEGSNWHEDLELELCTEGEGYLLLDAQRHPFRQGETAVIGSNVVHYTGTEGRMVYDCLILDAAFCREAGFDLDVMRFETRFPSEALACLFGELRALYADGDLPFRTAKLRLLALKILIELGERHTAEGEASPAFDKSLKTVKEAIVYMREHYAEKLTLEDIASHVLTDKYTLSRHFKRVTGNSVFGYLIDYRCKQAQALIQSGMRISEAAYASGFSNMSYFTKSFREKMGKLPSECKPNM